MLEHFLGQPPPQRAVHLVGAKRGQDGSIVTGVDHGQHVREILGGRAEQGRATDVDALDDLIGRDPGRRCRGGECVEIHDHEIDQSKPGA